MDKPIEYKFVGNTALLRLIKPELKGYCVKSGADIDYWINKNDQKPDANSEITFELLKNRAYVISQVTNLSTGYCPSPKSWNAVKYALEKIGIAFPDFFTTVFEFRICSQCAWINVIKDNHFVCINSKCQNELPVNDY